MASVIGTVRNAGFNAPWFLAKSTMQSDGVTLVPTVRAAVAAMANGTDIFLGPDIDARSGATNRNASSMPHLTDIGAQLVAGDWYTALDAVF